MLNTLRGLLNNRQIEYLCSSNAPMIENFVVTKQRKGVISYGLGAFGYDIRLSSVEAMYYMDTAMIDPKRLDRGQLVNKFIYTNDPGEKYKLSPEEKFFILRPKTCALATSIEKFNMPNNILGICVGKSTYARAGILVNITPLEPGWSGHLTVEVANVGGNDVVIYLTEGIAQIVFFAGNTPTRSALYTDKDKYQNQSEKVILKGVK